MTLEDIQRRGSEMELLWNFIGVETQFNLTFRRLMSTIVDVPHR